MQMSCKVMLLSNVCFLISVSFQISVLIFNNSSNFINSRYLCYILVLFAYFLVYFDTYLPLVITHISRYLSMLFLTSLYVD